MKACNDEVKENEWLCNKVYDPVHHFLMYDATCPNLVPSSHSGCRFKHVKFDKITRNASERNKAWHFFKIGGILSLHSVSYITLKWNLNY